MPFRLSRWSGAPTARTPAPIRTPSTRHPANEEGKAHCWPASTGSGLSFLSHYGWLAIGSAYRANSAKEGETLNSASWGHKLLWDTANGTGYSLLFEFSTQNIESSQCSFAFTCRYHSAQGGLRYWTAEYSTDGDTWKRLDDFTVPDAGNWSNMQLEQLSGDKSICLNVPAEILGPERGMDTPAPRQRQNRHRDDLRQRNHRGERPGGKRLHRLLCRTPLQQINPRTI